MKTRLASILILLAAVVGCAPAVEGELPPFVMQRIERYSAGPVSNPPAAIWRYTYKGRVVFYLPPSCCDVPGELYDGDGNVICGPDGGLTGAGDGNCADFFGQRSDGVRVWHDTRAGAGG